MTSAENTIVVRVKAGAKKENVAVIDDNTLEIEVKEKAKENRANERVRELVAEHFRRPLKAVRIVKGHHTPKKHVVLQ